MNPAFLRAYGYVAEDVIGQTPALVQSSQTPASVLEEILRESRRDGWTGELLNRRRDGTEFFVSLNTSAVRDDRGEIVGMLGVARDITDRLQAERALRDAEERMRFALDAAHVGVWETNLKTGVSFWSETCERMHGLNRERSAERSRRSSNASRTTARRSSPASDAAIQLGRPARHGPPHNLFPPLFPTPGFVRRRRTAPVASARLLGAFPSRISSASRRRWTRSASSPAASPTTSTTCSR